MRYAITFILTLIMIQGSISAQSRVDIDSLTIELKKLPDSCRLKKLYGLAYDNLHNNSYKTYSDLLLKEAERQHNDSYKASALFLIGKYYYSVDGDSMRMIIAKAEPLLLAQNRLEDACRMRGWNIYNYTREGQKEKVLPEVNFLKELARKYNYPDGEDMAKQALADYYLQEGLYKEGLELYEEVFNSMEKRNTPIMKRITIIRHLLNKGVEQNKQIYYLNKLSDYIQDCKIKGISLLDSETPLYIIQYFYHRYYAILGINTKNASLASTHLKQAEQIVENEGLVREVYVVKHIKLSYYELIGDLELAIKINDELLAYFEKTKKADYVMDRVQKKAELYYKTGREAESALIYRSLMFQKDSIRKAAFYNDLAKLRTQHDMDKLELKTKEMELEAEKTHSQLLIMGGSLILLLTISCLLLFIAYSRYRYGLQLKAAKEKAEETDRLKSAFLANMNHEIRTPLNAIVGFSQVLIDEDNKAVRAELAEIIQNNNELLQRLIADVLDISKIESNSIDFIYTEQFLPSLMKEIYNIILLRLPEGVKLELDECLPVTMDTDRNRLSQILTNLLTNAIKHTQEGHIFFGYKLIDSDIEFFVQDSGSGIPEEQLTRIFSRFVQLSAWSKGVGLGLAICKGLVEQMKGSISVKSKVGEGSAFYVCLPLRHEE